MPFVRTIAPALFIGLIAATPAKAPAPDPIALLRESVDAPKAASYVGQFQTIRFSSSRAIATIVKIEHLAPDRTRRWFLAPEALYGDYVIQSGGSTYEFDPKAQTVEVTHVEPIEDQVTQAGNLAHVLHNYRAVLDEPESIAGRPADSVELVNRYTGERALRVWLDRQTHLVLEKEVYHGNGSIASQTRFDNVRYTRSIPPAVFSTALPAGYKQTATVKATNAVSDPAHAIANAGFHVIEPHDLPQGFGLVGGSDATVDGVRTLQLVYTDGLRSLSLFENATGAAANFGVLHPKTIYFEGHDAQYVEDGPTTLLTWKEHGLHFALVGDLLRPELVAIAKSVIP